VSSQLNEAQQADAPVQVLAEAAAAVSPPSPALCCGDIFPSAAKTCPAAAAAAAAAVGAVQPGPGDN
jgi:hypothetical protein